jgi:RNA polymerase sigma factor (sigma-70 family)
MKKIKLKYDKQHELAHREKFWKEQNQYLYPNRGVYTLRDDEATDDWRFLEWINSEVDTYYLLEKLTPRQREVVQLRINGHNFKEIAKILNISVQTCYSHIKNTKKRLAIYLN